jgi:signal transduction histidine kinase
MLKALFISFSHQIGNKTVLINGGRKFIKNYITKIKPLIYNNQGENKDALIEDYENSLARLDTQEESCKKITRFLDTLGNMPQQIDDMSKKYFRISELQEGFSNNLVELYNDKENINPTLVFKIMDDIDPNTQLRGSLKFIKKSLSEIVQNSIDAYDLIPEKERNEDFGEIIVGVKKSILSKEPTIDIFIRDYGHGIDPLVKDIIFKDICMKNGKNRSGLSLFVMDIIIRSIGGNVSFDRNLTKGAEFYISLPIFND